MPGLLRGVARTAAIAGTATAVSGRVQRRQASKFAGRDAQIAADQTYAYQQDMAAQAPPQQYAPEPASAPPPAAPSENDTLAQLQQLGSLRDQGILTEDEFAAQKAKILAG